MYDLIVFDPCKWLKNEVEWQSVVFLDYEFLTE